MGDGSNKTWSARDICAIFGLFYLQSAGLTGDLQGLANRQSNVLRAVLASLLSHWKKEANKESMLFCWHF